MVSVAYVLMIAIIGDGVMVVAIMNIDLFAKVVK